MKKILIYLSLVIYLLLMSCGNKSQEHTHEGESEPHTHEADAEPHIHEGETEPHTHDAKSVGAQKAVVEDDGHVHDPAAEDVPAEDEGMNIDLSQIETKIIVKQEFTGIIKTSGQLIPDKSDEIVLTAPGNGIVSFASPDLFLGSNVSRGKSLFTVSGGNLVDNNIKIRYLQAQSEFEKISSEFNRASKLIVDKIISEKDFQQIKMEYEQKKVNFENLERSYLNSGLSVSSPVSGYISNILIKEGDYVQQGQQIGSVVKNKSIVIKAEVPQKYYSELNKINSANFKSIYDQNLYDINDLGGKKISTGRTGNMSPYYVPVYFRINNNGNFITGSVVEVYLKTEIIKDCLVIPKTALLEEQGEYYVYVREGEKFFHKHYVNLGHDDGENVVVLSGFGANSEIATKGAYHIKLASMSSSLPAHSHSH